MSGWLGTQGLGTQTAYTAVYEAANQFSIASQNLIDKFLASVKVKIYSGGEYKFVTVSSSEYSGGDTVVTIEESVLTNPCGNCFYSMVAAGSSGNLCDHDHSDGTEGGDDVIGAPPDHENTLTTIRFRKPDGTWGDTITLGSGGGSGSGGAASDETYALFYMS